MGINGEKILVFEHELFTNCSRIVQKLMRQLMGINGETFLGAHLGKTSSL